MIDDDLFEAARVPIPGERAPRMAVTRETLAALPCKHVPCGYFVLTLTDGSRKRFRIRLERGKFVPGHRTLSIHRKEDGPVDPHAERVEHEWETLATIGPEGFNVFKRWRGQWEARWADAIWKLLNGQPADKYLLDVEPRCWVTMQKLKYDRNREAGLCETWRKKLSPG
jgi:hypothetical protein